MATHLLNTEFCAREKKFNILVANEWWENPGGRDSNAARTALQAERCLNDPPLCGDCPRKGEGGFSKQMLLVKIISALRAKN